MTRPLVIAHRGFSAVYPENSAESYGAAIEAGADLVETDVRQASDGMLISCHDPSLARLAGRDLRIAETPGSTLLAVPLARGGRLGSLIQSLNAICGHRPALIDVKTQDLAIIDAIAAQVEAAMLRQRVWIGVRDAGQAARARALMPGVRVLAFLPDLSEAERFARVGVTAWRAWESWLDKPETRTLFERGPVWVTAGGSGTGREAGDVDAAALAAILRHGPGGVLLNNPDLLLRRAEAETA